MLTDILYNNHGVRLPRLLKQKCNEARKMNVKPGEDGINRKVFLTIIACHTTDTTKVKVVVNSIKKLEFPGNKIVIVSSENALYNNQMTEIVSKMYPDIEIYVIWC